MTFQNLYYFIEAVKDLNFSKTAERLFVSQQSISKHIGKLEEHYEVSLFERKPNLQLTPAGRLIAAKAELIFNIESKLQEELAQLKAHESLTISVKCNLTKAGAFFPQVLLRFAQLYPDVQITCEESRTNELGDTRIQDELLNHNIHFYIGEQIPADNPHIVKLPLLHDRNLFVMSKELYHNTFKNDMSLLSRAESGISLSDFGDIPFLSQEDINIPSTHAFFLHKTGGLKRENCLTFRKMPLNIMFTMCQNSLGIILVSQLMLSDYKKKGLLSLNDMYFFQASINEVPYYRELYLYYCDDVVTKDPALNDFPTVVCERFEELSESFKTELIIRDGCLSVD